MEKKKVTIESYKTDVWDFSVDIVDDEENECFEAWLYCDECDIKYCMITLPQKNVSITLFKTIVSANLRAHISHFCYMYLDDDKDESSL